MINNDILRRIATISNFSDEDVLSVFDLGNSSVSNDLLKSFYLEKDQSAYAEVSDKQLAGFLNGLIVEKRGPSDGPARENETELTNNVVFNKVKIAYSFKAEDVIEVMALADITLGKYELSAFFRNVNHKHYKACSDDVLSGFLKGLKIKHSK